MKPFIECLVFAEDKGQTDYQLNQIVGLIKTCGRPHTGPMHGELSLKEYINPGEKTVWAIEARVRADRYDTFRLAAKFLDFETVRAEEAVFYMDMPF
jgi:hypothetical protein